MFGNLRTWLESRQTLREWTRLENAEADLMLRSDNNPLTRAKTALALDNTEAAVQFWKEARSRYPAYVARAPESRDVLLGLKLFDEAEALMTAGMKRFPGTPHYAEGYALVAEHRGDRPLAIERWAKVRARFPMSWPAHSNAGGCLREIKRFDEAESLFKQAVKKFPHMPHGSIGLARVAEDRNDWTAALTLWRQVSDQFEHVLGALGQARALTQLGQLAEADALLAQAYTRFAGDPEISMTRAHLAERQGDTEAALERWSFVRQRFTQHLPGYRESIRFLKAADKSTELRDLLAQAAARFPSQDWR